MPGRQAHGRPLTSAPKPRVGGKKGSKARSQKNALDAFGIAQDLYPTSFKKTPRARELEAAIERKHGRDGNDQSGDDEDDDDEQQPRKKRAKIPPRGAPDDGAEDGSDSEGHEWRLGGLREDDEDSEIESDDAFGDSDNEKFQEYSFRGSKAKPDDDAEDDSSDDEGETLGADAVDLATALDQWEEDSDPGQDVEEASDSGVSDEEEDGQGGEDSDDDDEDGGDGDGDDDDDDEPDSGKLKALEGVISEYGGEPKADGKTKAGAAAKLSLGDLGLSGLNDPFMKKSVKLINKEAKRKRPGATQKLAVPLSRREQGRLDRSAALEKTNETLDRWTETVKHNRRAEHLAFPLAQNSATAGLDASEMQPLDAAGPANELESAVLSIMQQSGLSMRKAPKPKPQPQPRELDDEGNALSRKEALARKRMERELSSREAKRAKRIKKIKSKAYHRVHRKQRERDDAAAREAMQEAGDVDSEDEREAQDRRRALERVGQRHKESKWAKMGARAKRAVWDDDFRAGLTEMARKDQELRQRKEGKTAAAAAAAGGSDSDATSSSGSDDDDDDDGDDDIRRRLQDLEAEDDAPQSGLMKMRFMQKAEAAKKQQNDDMIRQIRRDLDGQQDSEEVEVQVGRQSYGTAKPAASASPLTSTAPSSSKATRGSAAPDHDDNTGVAIITKSQGPTTASPAPSPAGAWSRGEARRKVPAKDLDVNATILTASRRPAAPKAAAAAAAAAAAVPDDESDSDPDPDPDLDSDLQHLPLAIRDQALVARAFAGDDVVAEFAREKDAVAQADDDKVIDNTLPGWGSWVGDGVSNRDKKRHQGRFLTTVKGINKKDRRDAKLDKVIISEKRIKKNDRYLASQLPHVFESRQQYERSLRLPVGPEWMTKETFQDSTKPRVLMKQGIIAPISKPIL
ncbi:uncharacterized protein UV8b_00690 [Ustilaginoidea virens]|uniref:Uncharacterized protein n=1 Tax=Ustilaginoidea virens TaxID=1159556 RepID=A0A8E5HJB6_USTVR|nr:uncharacterized protein UV8b_00690 [Ustilaginoidea virens]QUC16449.1 hypothetical protein UV8b_00690 [Ustilaginoidea virens]